MVEVEPSVGALKPSLTTALGPDAFVASAATKFVVTSALARRHRRAALPGAFEVGFSDMLRFLSWIVLAVSRVDAQVRMGRTATVAQNSIISTVFMMIRAETAANVLLAAAIWPHSLASCA